MNVAVLTILDTDSYQAADVDFYGTKAVAVLTKMDTDSYCHDLRSKQKRTLSQSSLLWIPTPTQIVYELKLLEDGRSPHFDGYRLLLALRKDYGRGFSRRSPHFDGYRLLHMSNKIVVSRSPSQSSL